MYGKFFVYIVQFLFYTPFFIAHTVKSMYNTTVKTCILFRYMFCAVPLREGTQRTE